jgi:hypothetical protein
MYVELARHDLDLYLRDGASYVGRGGQFLFVARCRHKCRCLPLLHLGTGPVMCVPCPEWSHTRHMSSKLVLCTSTKPVRCYGDT